jgi:SAM-dependent methyltransferase
MSLPPSPPPSPDRVSRRPVGHREAVRAGRGWWDAEADAYYSEHGDFLGDDALVWGPEGWTEEQLGLLGELAGTDVLEVGAGAAQGGRWCAAQGARVVATDLSAGMLRVAHRVDADPRHQDRPVPAYVQCDGARLPFADGSFDRVMTAHGVLAFVPDLEGTLREWARVLRPGGRCVFSLPHPLRWVFPDVPGQQGLTVTHSYFDRRPYVEETADGVATYSEHHRTLGDLVRAVTAAGLHLVDLVEPGWPAGSDHVWGGWSRLRGELIPGTAVLVCQLR